MSQTKPLSSTCCRGWTAAIVLMGIVSASCSLAQAQDRPAKPIGRLVTIESPLTDETLGLVRRTGLELQDLAIEEQRPASLILEIKPGISQFHHAYALAEFLTSPAISGVSTIAWVPETISGNNVLVALSCNDIVLHPEASIGDMGRGKSLPDDQQTIVKTIVAKRRNINVNEPLAIALMDPSASLVQLTIDTGNGERETRLVSEATASQLLDDGVIITERKTLKEPGVPYSISGRDAQRQKILASRTADDRRELIDNYGLPIESLRELAPAEEVENVAYIELHDMIDDVFFAFAMRQINQAVSSGAKLIIFEIDSPGGYLWASQDLSKAIADLSKRDIRTIAYIPEEAFSGGAMLAVGCDEIYMKPDATIGNAIPVLMMPGVLVEAEAKLLSGEVKHLRELAEMKNRPAAVIEAFADQNLEVFEVTHKETGRKWYMSDDEIHKANGEWIKGPRITESRPGIAVIVNGNRAHELKIAETPISGPDELKERLGIPLDTKFRVVERSWVDTLVFYLNSSWVTGMLFFLAIVCIYIEMATMTGFFGIIAAAAFGVFFWSRMLGGTATGLEIGTFVLGLCCLGLEVFVIPGFGVFGVSGILMVVGSLVMASNTLTGMGIEYDVERAVISFAPFAASLVGVIIFAMLISRYLPSIPFLKEMVLAPPAAEVFDPHEPRLRPEHSRPHAELVGEVGKAVSVLRPAGKAQIAGRLYDVVSDGPFIEDGSQVSVVEVHGNRIVVRLTNDA
ncbi:hypothetical protein KOR42_29940 [Thalassoglobus neptunius]|uniref:Uncharacterized protein n=1 Tax=Thalassoglobus neptunius TaxID=1938619 RepID=A0A5C5WNU6_9PLAN|nr:NfeD family protein [Thalassoglobus neptunius]TWT52308.1 hypothetical protein KOR42_29940 [Thalassoglobus neptunius]